MKLQIGLLHLDGRNVSFEDRQRVAAEVDASVGEVGDQLVDGPLFIAYRGDRITHEEDCEIQPVRSGSRILTFDGRLDNREHIAYRLGVSLSDRISDAGLVMSGYSQFGCEIFKDLVGEFALVLASVETRSLYFVRSECGARTLFYSIVDNTLFWASDFAALVRASGVDLAVNDDYVIQYLLCQAPISETPLKNVSPAPPNFIVHFQNGLLKSSTEIWDPTSVPAIRFKTDSEYEHQFRRLVKAAVSARLRAKRCVCAELSGGLDSSTVVLMADRILRETGENPEYLQTLSFVYEQSKTCDESAFIEAVEQKRGIRSHHIREEEQRICTGLDDSSFTGLPNPLHGVPGRYFSIAERMRAHGARVLLTGLGGDHLFWSDLDGCGIVADELFKCKLLAAHRESRNWSRSANTPYYELLFGRAVPFALRSLLGREAHFKEPGIPSWLRAGRYFTPPSHFGRSRNWRILPSRRSQVFAVEHFFRCTASGLFAEYNELYVSHPYSYRPLVQFCLGIPIRQFLRDGQTRSLLRRAFRDLLPPKVARRVSKGLVDETIVRTVKSAWPDLSARLSSWKVCQREYVDHARLSNSLRQAKLGILTDAGPLHRLFSLERWLRSLEAITTSRSSQVSGYTAAARF